ncbi:hypothetical protein [Agrobacterium tumefaciens]|uniref:hypothetical protein n=1 Tax=Agrobacterium tumefaciens TaxID=358 RepID=UPI003B9E3955
MSTVFDFNRMLQSQFQKRLHEIADEEIAAANKRVADRIKREIDSIALSVLQDYDVYMNQDRLVITVKKAIG